MIWGTRLSLFFRVQSYLLTEISSVVCNIDDSYYVCSIVTKQEKRKPGNEASLEPLKSSSGRLSEVKPQVTLVDGNTTESVDIKVGQNYTLIMFVLDQYSLAGQLVTVVSLILEGGISVE